MNRPPENCVRPPLKDPTPHPASFSAHLHDGQELFRELQALEQCETPLSLQP